MTEAEHAALVRWVKQELPDVSDTDMEAAVAELDRTFIGASVKLRATVQVCAHAIWDALPAPVTRLLHRIRTRDASPNCD